MELVADGHDDVDERSSEAAEFKEIIKRLWGCSTWSGASPCSVASRTPGA
jgi:hypothetical protein